MTDYLGPEGIRADCRHIRWDRPCGPSKETGVLCTECGAYDPVGERILIVKLEALGDVLRTTAVLPPLKKKFPRSHITWIVGKDSEELVLHHPFLDRVLPLDAWAWAVARHESFDLLLNPDAAPESALLATVAEAKEKRGFGLDRSGRVFPYNAEAAPWLEMGLFDRVKRENRRTYQEVLCAIAGVAAEGQEIVFRLTEEERAFARAFAERHKISGVHPIIGIHTGAGDRWEKKEWTLEGYRELARRLAGELRARVLLFGGLRERERNEEILRGATEGVIDTGEDNSLRELAALLGICDVVVSGDTLAAHLAMAMKKKAVVLFGPSAPQEIDLYGRGLKIVPDIDCLVCYLERCERKPSCMDLIRTEDVFGAVRSLLEGV